MTDMRDSIHEVLDMVEPSGWVVLYTNKVGLLRLEEGDSFYVWSKKFAKDNDFPIRVHEKDLAVDSSGRVYVVDGLDVQQL